MQVQRSFCGFWNQRGYSLAELIAAVAITSATIITLVAVTRKGGEITDTVSHRQRARAVMDSCFEAPAFHHENYVNFASLSRPVLIDARNSADAADDLMGTLRIDVAVDTNKTVLGATPRNYVEFKRVTITVSWQEPEAMQSVTLQKMITKL